MCFLDRHDFENIDNTPGQNIEECGIGIGNMYPAVTVLQQLCIRGGVWILEHQQVLLDDPAIFIRQAVNVLERPFVDVYFHDASLFLSAAYDRCRVGRNLLPLRFYPGIEISHKMGIFNFCRISYDDPPLTAPYNVIERVLQERKRQDFIAMLSSGIFERNIHENKD